MWSEKTARTAVSRMLTVGCFFKIYPYAWDPVKYRLIPPSKFHIFCYTIAKTAMALNCVFLFCRFWYTIHEKIPISLRMVNAIWIFGYGLVTLCKYQFDTKRREIMYMVNHLFEYQDARRVKKMMQMKEGDGRNSDQDESWDWQSFLIVFTVILLVTNPSAHASAVLNAPCAPQYISSIYFTCKSAIDIPVPWHDILPFAFIEDILITDMMFVWTFNWTMLFLGMQWVVGVLEESKLDGRNGSMVHKAGSAFRYAQLIVVLVNDAFVYYLAWFAQTIIVFAALMAFGSIRFTDLDFQAYIVYPFCSIRCLFEAVSALAAGGIVNDVSGRFLVNWGKSIPLLLSTGGGEDIGQLKETMQIQKYHARIRKSCRKLNFTAGSMYTFENSIVLVTLHNCSLVTFNMLVTYK